ncbi:MAG TPA: glycerophosphodiester phosphodiesterase family protein [Candidatus Scybalocola faecavium]|nr:glycerophosphodiester phosphodiesterase family protein [Candidatus Scybalocola faecavium]
MFGKECYKDINRILNEKLQEKKALVAVHRGVRGGNITENTITAFNAALDMGGDAFECDVIRSTDGILYVFHDGTEPRNLNRQENIKTMSSQTIDQLWCNNGDMVSSGTHVEKLEDVLKYFCHGELFNIDRAWDIFPELFPVLDQYPHVLSQAIIKSPVEEKYLDFLDQYPVKYMYMPIVYSMEEAAKVMEYKNINLVGMELIAENEDADVYKDENIRRIREQNLFVWINVIKLGEHYCLFGHLDDDKALKGDPDGSWGEVLKKGGNILQTDWPYQLSCYRNQYFGLK